MRTANLPRYYNTIDKSLSKTSRLPKVECGHLLRLNAVRVTPTTPGLKRTREKLSLNELLLNSAWMLSPFTLLQQYLLVKKEVASINTNGCSRTQHLKVCFSGTSMVCWSICLRNLDTTRRSGPHSHTYGRKYLPWHVWAQNKNARPHHVRAMLIRYMAGSKTTTIFCAFFIMSVNVRERELAKLDGIDEQQNVEMLKPE